MLKIFVVVMLLSPGMSEPIKTREPVETYQACVDRGEAIRAKAIELNAKGQAFRVFVGCEFQSDKSDPS